MCICQGQMYFCIPACVQAYICMCLCDTLMCNVFVCRCHPSADVWSEGDLPPGWREISDSSEVYFWHVPTGTTQYHRPVASGNQHTSPNNEPDTERDLQQELQDSLKPPNEVRRPTDLTHGQTFLYLTLCVQSCIYPGLTSVGVF